MEKEIKKLILDICRKHIEKYNAYHNRLHTDHIRDKKRLVIAPRKEIKKPETWSINRLYNPFYVSKRINQITKSVCRKIENETYYPSKPYIKRSPKKGGGEREFSIFQIPDEAVSKYIYKKLLSKNRHRFSSLAYAYRNDRNAHFAINDIHLELKTRNRLYVAEYDFKDFFGTIDHNHIAKCLSENGFLINDVEHKIIWSFLSFRGTGIPLGTSISLFVANAICWKLDRSFEDKGVRFARYADDTILWSSDYDKIASCLLDFEDFSKESGVHINYNKSLGISIVSLYPNSTEFKSKEKLEFLGYAISSQNISFRSSAEKKIKKQISYILYKNLIQPLIIRGLKAPIASRYVRTSYDYFFVISIIQIRRYLYGDLSELLLAQYVNGVHKTLNFKGIMSYYPLVNDINKLIDLDKWLISTIMKALLKRKKILENDFLIYLPFGRFPHYLSHESLIQASKNHKFLNKNGLARIPSFLRIYKAINLKILNEGIEKTMSVKANIYYDEP
jgi:hypothetical protein